MALSSGVERQAGIDLYQAASLPIRFIRNGLADHNIAVVVIARRIIMSSTALLCHLGLFFVGRIGYLYQFGCRVATNK